MTKYLITINLIDDIKGGPMTVEYDWRPMFDKLIEMLRMRLKMGQNKYRGKGFKKAIPAIIQDFREEIEDSIIYLFMIYCKWDDMLTLYQYAYDNVIRIVDNTCPHCGEKLMEL